MKRSTLIIVGIIAVVAFTIGGFYLTRYSRQSTLKKALNINKLPASLKILNYSDFGVSNFRAEFYLSIDSQEFDQLLQGRKYDIVQTDNNNLGNYAVGKPGADFKAVTLYNWATAKNRTKIYVNTDRTLVYLIWDAE